MHRWGLFIAFLLGYMRLQVCPLQDPISVEAVGAFCWTVQATRGGWIGAWPIFRLDRFNTNFSPIATRSYEDQQASTADVLYWIYFNPQSTAQKMLKISTEKPGIGTTAVVGAVLPHRGTTVGKTAVLPIVLEQSEKQPENQIKIGVTFDSLGQTQWNLNHTFYEISGTYCKQRSWRSLPKFWPFSVWTKVASKTDKTQNWS